MSRSCRPRSVKLETYWATPRLPFKSWMSLRQVSGPVDKESNKMQSDFRKILAPPVFPEDEDKTRAASIVNAIGWITFILLLVILAIRSILARDVNLTEVNRILIAVSIAIVIMLFLSREGYVRTASVLLVATLWSGLSYISWV